MTEMSMGVIMGNRNFFSNKLCKKARNRLTNVLEENGINPIMLPEDEGVFGSVETREDAKKCAELFQKHAEEIKGIIVSLPNFSSEKGIAQAIRMSELDVPVLVQAFPDDVDKLDYENRRDSFCGKISVCNNLRQYGIDYTLTNMHNIDPEADDFKEDLQEFKGVCKVVERFKHIRVGVIGPRPADFNTVRYSEKILENNNISVEPVGVIDLVNEIGNIEQNVIDSRVEEIKAYINTENVPGEKIQKMAGFYEVLNNWIEDNDLDTLAIQCWDSLQASIEINPCAIMSILSNTKIPASCEVDVMGAVSMLALQTASDQPSALADWNNNFGDNPDKCILFHCGNYAKDLYKSCEMNYAEILGQSLGEENTYGAIYGQLQAGEITFFRLSTDDFTGNLKAYTAEGTVVEEDLGVNGSWGAVEVPELQQLLKYICNNGFEHHVGINLSKTADILEEAFDNYLDWEIYNHN